MAKIVKTSSQEAALKTITESIRIISRANSVYKAAEGADEMAVTVSVGSEKAIMPVSGADALKILAELRKDRVTKVKALSRKYAIELDDNDNEILAGGKKTAEMESVIRKERETREDADCGQKGQEGWQDDLEAAKEPGSGLHGNRYGKPDPFLG